MSESLAVIAGLGNPEERYADTLHNAGFWCVDELARRAGVEFKYEKRFDADVCKLSIHGSDIWLVKPQSFMNLSGRPVRGVLDYYRAKPEQLLVVHDEIDLPPGTVRLKKGGGHGGHNGIRDVMQHCGRDFMRLRVGVGHPGEKDKVTGHVLRRAGADLNPILQRSVDEAADIIPVVIDAGINEAMKELHTKSD
jgi:PTH1 family peptidyl-tRNA hydrolase